MKTLIIVLLVTFCFSAQANWVKKSEVKTPSNIYAEKLKCELVEGEICLDITGKDLRRFKLGLVDDLNDPNFRAVEDSPVKIDCNNSVDCAAKFMANQNMCLADDSGAKWDDFANWPGVTGVVGPWFIWCQKEDGTFKQIDGIVADAAGSTAADAADAQEASDNAARVAAKGPRDVSLQACVQDSKNPTMSPLETKDCLGAIVRKLLGDDVAIGDL